MTAENLNMRRGALAPAMIAVACLTIAGCATTHIREDWQCPPAGGARCVSVAVADPAVQGADPGVRGADQAIERRSGDAETTALPRLSRARSAHSQSVAAKPDAEDRAARRLGFACCNPFAFLARLLPGGSVDAGSADNGPAGSAPGNDEAQGAIAPEAPAPDAELRAPERIGRVWIAPYVDTNGVYREASWVRVVIVPADWKR